MRKKLNVRYLIKFLVVLALVGVGVFFLHKRQTGRLAESYKQQAASAKTEGDLARELNYLNRYLGIVPGDAEARARLGVLLKQTARSAEQLQQAFLVLERAIRENPKDSESRRELVSVAMDPRLSMSKEATEQLDKLIEENKNDPELFQLKGECAFAQGDFAKAEKCFEDAIKLKPDLVRAYIQRAIALRKQNNNAEAANKVIEKMVEVNPTVPLAHLGAASYWKQYGLVDSDRIRKVEAHVSEARRLAPDDPEVVLAVADVARTRANNSKIDVATVKAAQDDVRTTLKNGTTKLAPIVAKERDEKPTDPKDDKRIKNLLLLGQMYSDWLNLEIQTNQLEEAERIAKEAVANCRGNSELILTYVDVLIRRNQLDAADEQLTKLENTNFPAAVVDYHKARVFMIRNKPLEASKLLEQAVFGLGKFPAFQKQAYYLLGQCYEQLGDKEQSRIAYQQAIPTDPKDPLWIQVKLKLAVNLAENNQIQEALKIYEEMRAFAPGVVIPMVRLILLESEKLKTNEDWKKLEDLLEGVADNYEKLLLKAELFARQNKKAEAREILTKLQTENPKQIEPWLGLAFIEGVREAPEKVAQGIDAAEKQFGDTVEIRLARLRWLVLQPKAPTDEQLTKLVDGCDKFSLAEQTRLLKLLADVSQRYNLSKSTTNFLDRLTAIRPDDIGIHYAAFDQAIRDKQEGKMKAAMDQIARIEGPSGASTRMAKSMYLIWKAQQGDKSGLTEAKTILDQLEKERVSWSRVLVALGVIGELENDLRAVEKNYLEAIKRGDRNPIVIRRLMELYAKEGKKEDYNLVRTLVGNAGVNLKGLEQFEVEQLINTGKYQEALLTAQSIVNDNSDDPRKLLWLGRIRFVCGQPEEAERALRKALSFEAGQKDPEAWVSLVDLLVNTNRKAQAEELLKQSMEKLDPKDRPLVQAQCNESMKNYAKAKELYQEALKQQPNDVRTIRVVASFFMRAGELANAQQLFEKILSSPTKSDDDGNYARRNLAIILAANPKFEMSRKAMELIASMEAANTSGDKRKTVDDRRTKAVVLTLQRGKKPREEALKIYEELQKEGALSPELQFLMAQVYLRLNRWSECRAVMSGLMKADKENNFYIAFYAEALIRKKELEDADREIKKLEKSQPDRPLTIALKARLLKAQNNSAAAAKTIMEFVQKQKEPPLLAFASLCEELNLFPEAETLYNRFAQEKKPIESVLALAAYYGRISKTDQALQLVTKARKDCSPQRTVGTGLEILYACRQPTPEQIKQVKQWIEEALKSAPQSTEFLLHLASIHNLEERFDLAEQIYREILSREPNNALVMNNLAYLLAFKDQTKAEANQLIQKAKQLVGQIPQIMDTEASIQMAMGKHQEAIDLLQDAIVDWPDKVAYYHLALAYDGKGEKYNASMAYVEAANLNLKPWDLHPFDRKHLDKIRKVAGAPN